jgi:hypothetical protein
MERTIPLLDLNGLLSFLHYHKFKFELRELGGRVSGHVEANERFYELSERFNSNESVHCLDFVHCQREIRAMTMTIKNEKVKRTENESRKDL